MKIILYIALIIIVLALIILSIRFFQCKNRKKIVERYIASRESSETIVPVILPSEGDLIDRSNPCKFFSFK